MLYFQYHDMYYDVLLILKYFMYIQTNNVSNDEIIELIFFLNFRILFYQFYKLSLKFLINICLLCLP